jgi:hypothetical protein
MNRLRKIFAVIGGFSAAALGASPAFALGTASGTVISNSASVTYQIGGVTQPTVNTATPNLVTVDRKVLFTVTEFGGAFTTQVGPGQAVAVTTFQVTNNSNDIIDVGLSATQAGVTAAHGGTDNFDVTGVSLFVDTNGNNIYDAGTDTAITFLDELAVNGSKTVFVVASVPLAQVNGDIAAVALTGQARAGNVAGTQGAILTSTVGANTAGVDTVLADLTGGLTGDVNYDGIYIAKDDYTVQTATLSVVKQSRIVSDPVGNAFPNAKAIPGAIIEYCIQVTNAAGAGAPATSVQLSDNISSLPVTFVTGSNKIDATVSGANCTGGTTGGTNAAGTTNVQGTMTNPLAAGTSVGMYFQVTIN